MIVLRLKGGLGNQLFQYAAARALAMKQNSEVYFDLTLLKNRNPLTNDVQREYELHAFNIEQNFAKKEVIEFYNPLPTSLLKRISNRINKAIYKPLVYIEKKHVFDPELFELPKDCCIVGLFQSEKYFDSISGIIRNEFSFSKIFSKAVYNLASDIQSNKSICVHVRRGDYVTNPTYSTMLGTQSVQYYHDAINLISKKSAIERIFVFSDDIAWCKLNLKFNIETTYVSEELATADHHAQLYLMSLCRSFVISNSTFAWWGAWLSKNEDKIVVAPKVWFKDSSRDERDIVPKAWLKI